MKQPDTFETFWSAYPQRRPNPRAKARKVWDRRVRTARPEDIVAATIRYARECRDLKTDPKFVPHAATWLSQERDLDYPAPPAVTDVLPEAATPEERLKAAIGDAPHNSWIKPCTLLVDGDRLLILAPTSLTADRIRTRYLDQCRAAYGVATVEITLATVEVRP